MHSAANGANMAGAISLLCVCTVPFIMRTTVVELLVTEIHYLKYSKWFLLLFNFVGTGADNDLYINQAVVFIEDAIQVNMAHLLAILLPMLDICHTFCWLFPLHTSGLRLWSWVTDTLIINNLYHIFLNFL